MPRITTVFLTLTLALPAPSYALRPRAAGLEEPSPAIEELEAALRPPLASSSALFPQPAVAAFPLPMTGLEEKLSKRVALKLMRDLDAITNSMAGAAGQLHIQILSSGRYKVTANRDGMPARWREIEEFEPSDEMVDLLQPKSTGASRDVKEVQIILHDARAMLKRENSSRADLEALFRQLPRVIRLGAQRYFNQTGDKVKDAVLIEWRPGIQISLHPYGTGKPMPFRMIVNSVERKLVSARYAVLDLSQDRSSAGLEENRPGYLKPAEMASTMLAISDILRSHFSDNPSEADPRTGMSSQWIIPLLGVAMALLQGLFPELETSYAELVAQSQFLAPHLPYLLNDEAGSIRGTDLGQRISFLSTAAAAIDQLWMEGHITGETPADSIAEKTFHRIAVDLSAMGGLKAVTYQIPVPEQRLLISRSVEILSMRNLPAGLEEQSSVAERLQALGGQFMAAALEDDASRVDRLLKQNEALLAQAEADPSPLVQQPLALIRLVRLDFLMTQGISNAAVGEQAARDFQRFLPSLLLLLGLNSPLGPIDKRELMDRVSEMLQVFIEAGSMKGSDFQHPDSPLPEAVFWSILLRQSLRQFEEIARRSPKPELKQLRDSALQDSLRKALAYFALADATAGPSFWLNSYLDVQVASSVQELIQAYQVIAYQVTGRVDARPPPAPFELFRPLFRDRFETGARNPLLSEAVLAEDPASLFNAAAVGLRRLEGITRGTGRLVTADFMHGQAALLADAVRRQHSAYAASLFWGRRLFPEVFRGESTGLEETGIPPRRDLYALLRKEKVRVLRPKVGDLAFGLLMQAAADGSFGLGVNAAIARQRRYMEKILRGDGIPRSEKPFWKTQRVFAGIALRRSELGWMAKELSLTPKEFLGKLGVPSSAKQIIVIDQTLKDWHRTLFEETFHILEGPSAVDNSTGPHEIVNDFLQLLFFRRDRVNDFQSPYTHWSDPQKMALQRRYREELGFNPNTQMRSIIEALQKDFESGVRVTVGPQEAASIFALMSGDYFRGRKTIPYLKRLLKHERFSQHEALFAHWNPNAADLKDLPPVEGQTVELPSEDLGRSL